MGGQGRAWASLGGLLGGLYYLCLLVCNQLQLVHDMLSPNSWNYVVVCFTLWLRAMTTLSTAGVCLQRRHHVIWTTFSFSLLHFASMLIRVFIPLFLENAVLWIDTMYGLWCWFPCNHPIQAMVTSLHTLLRSVCGPPCSCSPILLSLPMYWVIWRSCSRRQMHRQLHTEIDSLLSTGEFNGM